MNAMGNIKGAVMDGSSSAPEKRTKIAEIDFLSLELTGDLVREGGEFVVRRPWAMARLEALALRGGWWTLECEGEGDLSGVEVRVSTPRDPLVVFPGKAHAAYRILLPNFESYDVALLISPWPGRAGFSKLKLRRLSAGEGVGFLVSGVGRLMRSRDPIGAASRLTQRLFAGQSVGVAVEPAAPPVAQPKPKGPMGRAARTHVERGQGIEVVLAEGDRLHPNALAIVAEEFARSPGVQVIYADACEGGGVHPRPGFDPVLAQMADYAGPPVFFRTSGESDAWIRLRKIASASGPAAISRIALPLVERDTVLETTIPAIPQPALDPAPRVSAIVPTKKRVDLLEKCLEGLRTNTGYPNLEVVVVDNGVEDSRFWDIVAAAKKSLDVVLVEDHDDFNFSRLINNGVSRSTGEIVLSLNDDVTPIESGWLHRMVESAMAPDVGAVGARLLFPDGAIQHAGVMLGLGGVAGHLWKGTPKEEAERNPFIALPSSRLAVTGACLAVRRSVFEQAGGLEEAAFPVALNDIDFCLRLNAKGLQTIYRGDAVLIHHEGRSRGQDDQSIAKRRRLAEETRKFLDRWKRQTWDDPWGSPAFDPQLESGAVHRALRK